MKKLTTLRIFNEMDDREIAEIMVRADFTEYSEGDIVFEEGQNDDSIYIIVEGNFEFFSISPKSKEKISFFFAGEGLIFGEMSFLDNQPRSASVLALQNTEVLILSRKNFNELLENKPGIAAKFMMGLSDILSRRLRAMNQRLKHSIYTG